MSHPALAKRLYVCYTEYIKKWIFGAKSKLKCNSAIDLLYVFILNDDGFNSATVKDIG